MDLPKRDHVLQEISALEKRIEGLRQQLIEINKVQTIENVSSEKTPALDSTSLSPNEKVKLFLRLFRGRDDVYPKRWQNQTSGKSGYSPACANEWVRGVCEKPRVKCSECLNQAFLPVTNETILSHLQGRHVIGVYPMLVDDTC
jgi:hypothetical protein